MKDKKTLIIVGVVLLLVAGVGFWFWSKNRQTPSIPPPQVQKAPTLGGTIFEKTQNPLGDKLPEINPFKAQRNPFDAIYENPFK